MLFHEDHNSYIFLVILCFTPKNIGAFNRFRRSQTTLCKFGKFWKRFLEKVLGKAEVVKAKY